MLANRDFVRQNMMFHQTKTQKGRSHTKGHKSWFQHTKGHPKRYIRDGTNPLSRVCHMTWHTTEPINFCAMAIFTFIIVYSYTSISKQKFPFVSEAKEGYLSTPLMSCSCIHISPLHHTKSLTNVVPSYEVPGLHITPPFIFFLKTDTELVCTSFCV